MLKGLHLCDIDKIYGDWRIDEKEYILNLKKIKPFLTKESKKLINFKDIGHKGKNSNYLLHKERYDAADISYPCILTEGQNPYNCKYRMIDGKHRITKMKNMGIKKSMFYIVDFNIFFKLLQL
tara:strand:- start:559 stop:927 length:369 start_codon:yes stop_codon:yes gene_type:complete